MQCTILKKNSSGHYDRWSAKLLEDFFLQVIFFWYEIKKAIEQNEMLHKEKEWCFLHFSIHTGCVWQNME